RRRTLAPSPASARERAPPMRTVLVLVAVLAAGALAWVLRQPAYVPSELLPCPRCSVVLLSIDTLRADHLGVYDYARPTSPRPDALAAHALVFERAYSTSYNTADSHMSMFTALYPSVHGVRNVWDEEPELRPLHPGIPTLPELL